MTSGHCSVLLNEVVELLKGFSCGWLVDGTVGLGGHAEALLANTPSDVCLLAMDRDPNALAASKARLAAYGHRVAFVHKGYEELPGVVTELRVNRIVGVLLDLGLSSEDLTSDRGFSIQRDGPLDMRFDPTDGPTAAEVVRVTPEPVLAACLREFGEFPGASRLAKRLKEDARRGQMNTMGDFVRACREVLGPRIRGMPSPILPAQALRIMTNRELERLDIFLANGPELLAPAGRLVIISYHSLEDRRVKRAFAGLNGHGFRVLTKKPVRPTREEISKNRRARSARLRALEREAA